MILQAIHERNKMNTGDMQSCFTEHFDVYERDTQRKVEIIHLDLVKESHLVDPAQPVIIGGGGMLVDNLHSLHLKNIIDANRYMPVLWGIGVNNNNKAMGDKIPAWVKQGSIAGIRDWQLARESENQYVPCASCLHAAFDKEYAITHEAVCFEGNKLNLPLPTHHCGEGMPMEEIIAFLASGRTIVTSSYHGMYWGTLLNREVIVIPNAHSSKFYYFLRHVPNATVDNWKQFIGHGISQPGFLQECRDANMDFARFVERIFSMRFVLKNNSNPKIHE